VILCGIPHNSTRHIFPEIVDVHTALERCTLLKCDPGDLSSQIKRRDTDVSSSPTTQGSRAWNKRRSAAHERRLEGQVTGHDVER